MTLLDDTVMVVPITANDHQTFDHDYTFISHDKYDVIMIIEYVVMVVLVTTNEWSLII